MSLDLAIILDRVKKQLGPEKAAALAPIIDEYGPRLVEMGEAGIVRWIGIAARGDSFETFKALYENSSNGALVAEWSALDSKWKAANVENAANLDWARKAQVGILKAIVTVALATVGL